MFAALSLGCSDSDGNGGNAECDVGVGGVVLGGGGGVCGMVGESWVVVGGYGFAGFEGDNFRSLFAGSREAGWSE